MTDSKISLDSTRISVVVTCSACPWWYGFAFTRDEGWTVGQRHQSTFHNGQGNARKAAHEAEKRAR